MDIEHGLSCYKEVIEGALGDMEKDWVDCLKMQNQIEELVDVCKFPSFGHLNNIHPPSQVT